MCQTYMRVHTQMADYQTQYTNWHQCRENFKLQNTTVVNITKQLKDKTYIVIVAHSTFFRNTVAPLIYNLCKCKQVLKEGW